MIGYARSQRARYTLGGLRLAGSLAFGFQVSGAVRADEPSSPPTPVPVDESMHHFMEYFYEPAYKRLKTQVAEKPQERSGWNAIKGDALTLAEGANLLLLRAPEEGREAWGKLSVEVREAAGKVYQAARGQDYDQARQHYTAMISRCNACHKEFAKGKHQLTP